ncbi:uncharacterized protein [Amphiura filiformis]|uniref:uncharacterized protein n=1 Tax=Amphiura filiformis TaxID=82378 RepID=UPI003B20E7B3
MCSYQKEEFSKIRRRMATPRASVGVSEFAKKQLEKHGWKQGKGLGKSESGIAAPIKVKIKHDTAGVGHDLGEQFTYHWWDHVFNKAANNIEIENDQDGVRVKQKGDNAKIISNKKQHTKPSNKPLLYGNFVKSATLVHDVEQQEDKVTAASDDDDDSDGETDDTKDQINRDEQFYRACGGRTAHKGARHGLKSSGKLRRIQAQESLHSHSTKTGDGNTNDFDPKAEIEMDEPISGKKIKKKKKKGGDAADANGVGEPDESNGGTNQVTRTANEFAEEKLLKKQKKREKRKRNRTSITSGALLEGDWSDRTDNELKSDTVDNVESGEGMVSSIQQGGEVLDRPVKKKRKKSKSKNKQL